jgi:hypothetical protein
MARNLNVPEVEAVIVASCPELHQDLVTEICKGKHFQKVYSRSEVLVNSVRDSDWMGKWRTKVVMASITKAQSLNIRRIKIICIEGGKYCDEEHACLPHLKKEIAIEWTDSGHTAELHLECLRMGYDSFVEYYGHEIIVSKVPPVMNEDSAKIDKADPKHRQLDLSSKLPIPPPESVENPGNIEPSNNTEVTAPEFSCDECSSLFTSREALLEHLQETDHKVTVYYCTICSGSFSVSDKKAISPLNRLEQHQGSTGHTGIHKVDTTVSQLWEWECGECQKTFKTEKARNDHQVDTGHRSPTDLDCKHTFSSQESLEPHISATRYIEIVCDSPTSFPSNPIQSNQGLLPVDATSPSEDPSNNTKGTASDNLRDPSYGKEHCCDVCSSLFVSREALLLHLQDTDHKFTVHYCTVCNDAFSIIDSTAISPLNRLEQHQCSAGHTGIHKFQTSFSQLMDKLSQNNENNYEEWECGDCQKTFKVDKARDYHQVATGDRSPTCLDCKNTFGGQESFEQHISATEHTEILDGSCDSPTSFPSNSIHSNQELLPVGATSPSEEPLKNTTVTAPGFSCDECSSLFTSREAFFEHLQETDHKVTVHYCTICSGSFSVSDKKAISPLNRLEQHQGSTGHTGIHKVDTTVSQLWEWECGECQKTFKTEKARNDHQVDTGHRSPTDLDCKHTFSSQESLEPHISATRYIEIVCDSPTSFPSNPIQSNQGLLPVDATSPSEDPSNNTKGTASDNLRDPSYGKEHCCDVCSSLFVSREALLLHLQDTDHKFTVHYCTVCNDAFSIIDSTAISPLNRLEQHQCSAGHTGIHKFQTSFSQLMDKLSQNNENNYEEWECGDCQKTFKVDKARDYHQVATGDRSPTCLDCKNTFGGQESFEQHISATDHTEIVDGSCDSPTSFPSNSIHSNPELLPVCATSPSEEPLKNTTVTAPGFSCDECSSLFTSREALLEHLQETNHNVTVVYYCTICSGAFSVSDKKAISPLNRLEQHQSSTGHTGIHIVETTLSQLKDEEWECGECQKTFKTEKAREYHQVATDHRAPTCLDCKKTFGNQKSLEQHISVCEASVKVVTYLFSFILFRCTLNRSLIVSRNTRSFFLMLGVKVAIRAPIIRSKKLQTDFPRPLLTRSNHQLHVFSTSIILAEV